MLPSVFRNLLISVTRAARETVANQTSTRPLKAHPCACEPKITAERPAVKTAPPPKPAVVKPQPIRTPPPPAFVEWRAAEDEMIKYLMAMPGSRIPQPGVFEAAVNAVGRKPGLRSYSDIRERWNKVLKPVTPLQKIGGDKDSAAFLRIVRDVDSRRWPTIVREFRNVAGKGVTVADAKEAYTELVKKGKANGTA